MNYVDREPDRGWVWDTLVCRSGDAGLQAAVSRHAHEPGVERVVAVEQRIVEAKRRVVVLSAAYLGDSVGGFEKCSPRPSASTRAPYRVSPVMIAGRDDVQLPVRLRMRATRDLTHPRPRQRNLEHLVDACRGPLPRRRGP